MGLMAIMGYCMRVNNTSEKLITMKRQIHPESGKPFWVGTTLDTHFDPSMLEPVPDQFDTNRQWALHTDIGSLTVLDRMTGFGYRDVETGFRDPNGQFWLSSGHQDVRLSGATTLGEAIAWVKQRSTSTYQPNE
jgi:hypothetical protein